MELAAEPDLTARNRISMPIDRRRETRGVDPLKGGLQARIARFKLAQRVLEEFEP